MRIRILSDLHLEFAPFIPPAAEADVVVLAGDIHLGTRGLEWAAATFPQIPVLYVPGNHELYKGDWRSTPARLRAAAGALGIHLLDTSEAVLGEVRFLGCNLWTDFELYGEDTRARAYDVAKSLMVDYRAIRNGERPLVPEDTRALHLEQRSWLEAKLAIESAGRWSRTVVVTHTLPTMASVAERFRGEMSSAGFASNLDHLVRRANLWIHGHTHTSFDYALDACRVVCNPRGYVLPGRQVENPEFDPGLVVEIP